MAPLSKMAITLACLLVASTSTLAYPTKPLPFPSKLISPQSMPTNGSTTTSAAACPRGTNTKTTINQPALYNLYPSQPDLSQPNPVTYIEVQVNSSYPHLEQAAVFRGIPAAAKTCTLGWAQSDNTTRRFVVDGSGLVDMTPLTGFPEAGQPVNSNSIKPFENSGAAALNPDFTSWDQIPAAEEHVVGPVDCAEEVYFKLAIDTRNGDGHVYFEQDERNGLFLDFTC